MDGCTASRAARKGHFRRPSRAAVAAPPPHRPARRHVSAVHNPWADPATPAPAAGVDAVAFDQFLVLWLDSRRKLSVGQQAAGWVLEDVEAGLLPCNAELVCGRARALNKLAAAPGDVNARWLLNNCRHVLRHDSDTVASCLRRAAALPTAHSATAVAAALLPELHATPWDLAAVQYLDWDMAYEAVTGAHLPQPLFSHLLRSGTAALEGRPGGDAAVGDAAASAAVEQPPPPAAAVGSLDLADALRALVGVLGPELTHAGLARVPELLGVGAEGLGERLEWLRRRLKLREVEARMVAERHAQVLLMEEGQLEGSFRAVAEQLGAWTGWPPRVVVGFVRRQPDALAAAPEALAARWAAVAWAAQARPAWRAQWRARRPGTVAAALGAGPRQIARLEFAAQAQGELLRGMGLPRVLYLPYVRFLEACPPYRRWRLAQAGVPPPDAGLRGRLLRAGGGGAAAAAAAAARGVRLSGGGGSGEAPGTAEVELVPIEGLPAVPDLPPEWL